MAFVAGAILVFITAAVCYTIGMRYLFTKTTIWIIPMTEYALLWIVFLATTWLLRDGGHVITEILYAHLPAKTKLYLDCIMFVIGGLACAIMVLLGSHHMYECMINGVTDVRAITVPKSAIFSIVPIGSLFLTIQFFRMAWSRFVGMWEER
jgi:TRAP-type C4-dicarboxylate transport system permease small subunit